MHQSTQKALPKVAPRSPFKNDDFFKNGPPFGRREGEKEDDLYPRLYRRRTSFLFNNCIVNESTFSGSWHLPMHCSGNGLGLLVIVGSNTGKAPV